jgi:hypothetical protein
MRVTKQYCVQRCSCGECGNLWMDASGCTDERCGKVWVVVVDGKDNEEYWPTENKSEARFVFKDKHMKVRNVRDKSKLSMSSYGVPNRVHFLHGRSLRKRLLIAKW